MKNRTLIIIFLTALLLCGVLLRAADKGIFKNDEKRNELKKEALKKDMELMAGIFLL